jgi:hypothetical protein
MYQVKYGGKYKYITKSFIKDNTKVLKSCIDNEKQKDFLDITMSILQQLKNKHDKELFYSFIISYLKKMN